VPKGTLQRFDRSVYGSLARGYDHGKLVLKVVYRYNRLRAVYYHDEMDDIRVNHREGSLVFQSTRSMLPQKVVCRVSLTNLCSCLLWKVENTYSIA
jgi:hypothetical protein